MDQQGQVDHPSQGAIVLLPSLERSKLHTFIKPVKRIHEGHDVPKFLTSCAYVDIGKFVMLLNISMCPRKIRDNGTENIETWQMANPEIFESESIQNFRALLEKIGAITAEVPPDTGPRRFGNISFRKWHEILESRVTGLLKEYLPADVLNFRSTGEATASDELIAYLLGSFGSPQRLDYGTGHELSFLAFLGCIWKLNGFQRDTASQDIMRTARNIVLGIIEP
jgi:serine/threonine-protein phosphatase 2A activator